MEFDRTGNGAERIIMSENEKKEVTEEKKVDDFSDLEADQLSPIVATDVKVPMSTYGIGPVFGLIAIALTVAGVLLRDKWIFKSGIPDSNIWKYSYLGLGILVILVGLLIYWRAVFGIKIDNFINSGKLCTTGIYAWTRNPIYAAIIFVSAGALFISGNVYMYVIPILLWALLTVLLKKTEERDMLKRFGQEYLDYMVKVNRILPKPPAK